MGEAIEKRIGWLGEQKGTWWFSVLLNGLLLLFFLLAFQPSFETNDDTTMYELTGGAKGSYDARLIFIHVIPGMVLKGLYTVLPFIQWYTVLQYAVMFAAFTALSYVCLNRLRTSAAILVFGTLYCYFAYQGFILIQFSKTAGFAVCGGILLMFHALERKKGISLPLVCGMALALIGGWYRNKEFLLCAALLSGLGIYELLHLQWKKNELLWRTVGSYVGSFGLLALLFAGGLLLDGAVYAADARFGDYLEFNDLRSDLLDYGVPDYEGNEETYQSLGLTEKDVELFRSSNFADPEVFTEEVFRTLKTLCHRRELNRGFVSDYFRTFPIGFFKIPVFTGFLQICCYWLFWGVKDRKKILVLVYEAVLVGLAYAYLFYLGRYLVSRVETAMWLAVSLVVVWLLNREKEYFDRRTGLAFCACTVAFNMNTWKSSLRQEQTDGNVSMLQERELMQQIGDDKDHVYLVKLGQLSTFTSYGPFDVVPFGSEDNLCKLGGWEYGAPTNDSVLERYGISNPYRDMLDNPQVIVVDNKAKTTLEYLRRHYDERAKAYQIKEIAGRRFYVFRTEPLVLDESGCEEMGEEAFFCTYDTAVSEDGWEIRGILYEENTNSYEQLVYLKVTDKESGETSYYNCMTFAAAERTDLQNGQYGGFLGSLETKQTGMSREDIESGRYSVDLILENETGMYRRTIR